MKIRSAGLFAAGFATVFCLVLSLPVLACMWDHDTLQQERARFPTAIELITGKFLRHSRESYEWRIKDRLQKLSKEPSNLSYYDDLGVAYQKTGQHEKAVAIMLAKDKIKSGLYETEANLGTFYILSGNLDEGLGHVDKALQINPHAHFDRERYQKWLVEYALSRRKDGQIHFPLRDDSGSRIRTFADFLANRLGLRELPPEYPRERIPLDASRKAVQAVLGMMRFADYDNPLLLEALGDLLSQTELPGDAKRLATRAYLSASYKFKGKAEENEYRQIAARAIIMQTVNAFSGEQLKLSQLEADFTSERSEADKWYTKLRSEEDRWIRQGLNADSEFDKLYTAEPKVIDKNELPLIGLLPVDSSDIVNWLIVLCFALIILLIVSSAMRLRPSHKTDGD